MFVIYIELNIIVWSFLVELYIHNLTDMFYIFYIILIGTMYYCQSAMKKVFLKINYPGPRG